MAAPHLTATVVGIAPLTRNVVRMTFAVPGFESCGAPDEWVHIFLGAPGDHRRRRNYTIRAIRKHAAEVDIDFALHERGLAVDWARAARPGDELVWGDVTGAYAAPDDTVWRLLVGDLAALPAIGRIVEELPAGARALVVAEVFDAADRQHWETAGDIEVTWLHGSGDGRTPSRLKEAVRTFAEPPGQGYVWMAGETRTVRATRRYVRHERGIARERYSLTGYWLVDAEAWERRYEQVAARLEAIWERTEQAGVDTEAVMDDYDAALEEAGL